MLSRDTGRAYTASTSDEALEWWGDEEYSPRQSRLKRRAQRLPETLKTPENSRSGRRRSDAVAKAWMYVAITLAVLCVFAQVARYAQIAINSKRISTLSSEIKEFENQKENLVLRLNAVSQSDRLVKAAGGLTDMKKATVEQTRVINLDMERPETLTIIAANTAK